MRVQRAAGSTGLGAYFGRVAQLEDLAVYAFAEIGRELEYLGAPAELIERARRAQRDEVKHAALMRALARRFGGVAARAKAFASAPRALAEFARANIVEGCVRETFGVLVGMWQSRFAGDKLVRFVMRRVARD
jgi:hypothetical protein